MNVFMSVCWTGKGTYNLIFRASSNKKKKIITDAYKYNNN